MTAQEDKELINWVMRAYRYGGEFITQFCIAVLGADSDNYRILRPVIITLRAKYPQYDDVRFKIE